MGDPDLRGTVEGIVGCLVDGDLLALAPHLRRDGVRPVHRGRQPVVVEHVGQGNEALGVVDPALSGAFPTPVTAGKPVAFADVRIELFGMTSCGWGGPVIFRGGSSIVPFPGARQPAMRLAPDSRLALATHGVVANSPAEPASARPDSLKRIGREGDPTHCSAHAPRQS